MNKSELRLVDRRSQVSQSNLLVDFAASTDISQTIPQSIVVHFDPTGLNLGVFGSDWNYPVHGQSRSDSLQCDYSVVSTPFGRTSAGNYPVLGSDLRSDPVHQEDPVHQDDPVRGRGQSIQSRRDQGRDDPVYQRDQGRRDPGRDDPYQRDQGTGRRDEARRDEARRDEARRDPGRRDPGRREQGRRDAVHGPRAAALHQLKRSTSDTWPGKLIRKSREWIAQPAQHISGRCAN